MDTTIFLFVLAVACWWRGHHLLALPLMGAAITTVWPEFPSILKGWALELQATPTGQTVTLYAVVLAIPVLGVLIYTGWRPKSYYRSFEQPRHAKQASNAVRNWIKPAPAAKADEKSGDDSGSEEATAKQDQPTVERPAVTA